MSISRRDFFVSAFGKAVNHIHNFIPAQVQKVLGLSKEPLSCEEAAFAINQSRRKSSSKSVNPAIYF